MWAMAGNLPGFEEASRALFAGDRQRLEKLLRRWPKDVPLPVGVRVGKYDIELVALERGLVAFVPHADREP